MADAAFSTALLHDDFHPAADGETGRREQRRGGQIVDVATFGAGLFKTIDSGRTWQALGDAGATLWLAIDPMRPHILYAGDNIGNRLQKSVDGGATWRPVNQDLPVGPVVRAMSTRPPAPIWSMCRAATARSGGGLNVSTDGGATWTSRRVGSLVSYVWSTGVDRRSGAVYAGTVGEGLWRSTDGGGTWTQAITPFVSNLTVDPRDPNLIYAALQTGGVLRSRDGGATFTAINSGLTSLRTSRGNGVVIDPRNSDVLHVGTEDSGVFKSTSGGESR